MQQAYTPRLDNSGSNTHNITFTPTSQADKDNYDNSVKYPVQFDVDNIVLTFDLSQIDRTIVVPLVYNNNYNYTWIIDEFNKRFAENSKTDEAYRNIFPLRGVLRCPLQRLR